MVVYIYYILNVKSNIPMIRELTDMGLNNVIGKDNENRVYGDYSNDENLGVIIGDADGRVYKFEETIETAKNLSLSHEYPDLGVNSETASAYYLYTNDLDVPEQEITEDTKYSFAFVGENPISISAPEENSYKAIFEGDNSKYTPADNSLTLPSDVVFAGNNSLFPITQTYGHGTFAGSASELNNEVPSGKTITFEMELILRKGIS